VVILIGGYFNCSDMGMQLPSVVDTTLQDVPMQHPTHVQTEPVDLMLFERDIQSTFQELKDSNLNFTLNLPGVLMMLHTYAHYLANMRAQMTSVQRDHNQQMIIKFYSAMLGLLIRAGDSSESCDVVLEEVNNMLFDCGYVVIVCMETIFD
jgi:hypothetical protein